MFFGTISTGTEQAASSAQFQFLAEKLPVVLSAIQEWQGYMPGYTADPTLNVNPERWNTVWQEFITRLSDNYPFFHPLYAGQMLKPPHPAAVIGYLSAMLINPNNHALDGGPATAKMEKETIAAFAHQFGFHQHLGHLTSSGTIANLEALWIARELHPDKAIAFSSQAHYTHQRMSDLLKAHHIEIPSTPTGVMDMNALRAELAKRNIHSENASSQSELTPIGTVVATLGTTALGALDPLPELIQLKAEYGFRIHVDMAYGGYYHLLKDMDADLSVFQYLNQVDSVVIDPHKHGLQPYGCGCVLFADPAVGRFYKHDSPYTYFTSPDELHLGEISLECSRAGAAAAALWLTLQLFPLEPDSGMGAILQKTRQAARQLVDALQKSSEYQLYLKPQLDIVTFYPKAASTQAVSLRTHQLFQMMMRHVDYPLYLATLNVCSCDFSALHPGIEIDSDQVMIFRSCLMKPEHADWASRIAQILEHHAKFIPAN